MALVTTLDSGSMPILVTNAGTGTASCRRLTFTLELKVDEAADVTLTATSTEADKVNTEAAHRQL